jgi:hypothetical protein
MLMVSETDLRFGLHIFAWLRWCLVAKQKGREPVKESAEGAGIEIEVPRGEFAMSEEIAVKPVSEVESAVSVMPPTSVPSIEVKVARPFYEGLEGIITDVNVQYFANINATGIMIEITRDDGETFSESLWWRPYVGAKSKLGAFANALGSDYSRWKGKRVRIVKWSPGDRRVEVVHPPK